MSIRKEQLLFLIVLALGAWLVLSTGEQGRARRLTPQTEDYGSVPVTESVIASTDRQEFVRELFDIPTESRPLPPRDDLPFPDLPEISTVVLPLQIGPQPGAYHRLRMPLRMQPAKEEQAAPGDVSAIDREIDELIESLQQGDPQDSNEDRYDVVSFISAAAIQGSLPGFFLGPDEQKYDYGSRLGPYPGTLDFQWVVKETGETLKVFQGDEAIQGSEVKSLKLADTLRNQVHLAAVEVPTLSTNLERQRQLILFLLQEARKEAWIFDLARERAEAYLQFVSPAEDGHYMIAQVLWSMGDLPGLYDLFRGLEGTDLEGSSFQLRGLGRIEDRLGLDELAESHLREAVRINLPIDSRNYAALADFYLRRGRPGEAVEHARAAVSNKGNRSTFTHEEKIGFHTVLVRALLAVGDVEGASAAVAAGVPADLRHHVLYQEACVAYASRDFPSAQLLFEECNNSGQLPDALLGIGACQLAQGELDAAAVTFGEVAEQNPRLRHLALAGTGLAASLVEGRGADALESLDSASLVFPDHPYILYLQGRQRRLNGDLEGAVEILKRALRIRDDFLDALAELTVTYYQMYEQDGTPVALINCQGYVDRLVGLDQRQGGKETLFLEMQGKIHYEARDLRSARLAFEAGEEESVICQVGLAMLDHTQKRAQSAQRRLRGLITELGVDDPVRQHADHLRTLILRHDNLEQVGDRFDRGQLGRNWRKVNGSRPAPRLRDGVLQLQGPMERSGISVARRILEGPGRFIELSIDMKIEAGHTTDFVGVAVDVPGTGATESRFRVRLGVDERGRVVLELRDGPRAEPILVRSGTIVTTGEWHTMSISVAADDDQDPQVRERFLSAYFDEELVTEPVRLRGLRAGTGAKQEMYTDLIAEGVEGQTAQVGFRNYHRLQERAN